MNQRVSEELSISPILRKTTDGIVGTIVLVGLVAASIPADLANPSNIPWALAIGVVLGGLLIAEKKFTTLTISESEIEFRALFERTRRISRHKMSKLVAWSYGVTFVDAEGHVLTRMRPYFCRSQLQQAADHLDVPLILRRNFFGARFGRRVVYQHGRVVSIGRSADHR